MQVRENNVGDIVQNILQQLSQLRNADEVKKVLFLRLEMELNSRRGVIVDDTVGG